MMKQLPHLLFLVIMMVKISNDNYSMISKIGDRVFYFEEIINFRLIDNFSVK